MKIISAFGTGVGEPVKGYVGISADYPFFQDAVLGDYLDAYFESKRLGDYVEWSGGIFDEFLVCLPDWLLHYNLMAFEGMGREESLALSSEIGDYLERKCIEAISAHPGARFIRWPECDVIEKVRDYSGQDRIFSQHCLQMTHGAVHNRLKITKAMHGKERCREILPVLHRYAVDDVGMMLQLNVQGYVGVSKYEPPGPMKHFLHGKYPRLSSMIGLRPEQAGHIQAVVEGEDVFGELYDDRYEGLEVIE